MFIWLIVIHDALQKLFFLLRWNMKPGIKANRAFCGLDSNQPMSQNSQLKRATGFVLQKINFACHIPYSIIFELHSFQVFCLAFLFRWARNFTEQCNRYGRRSISKQLYKKIRLSPLVLKGQMVHLRMCLAMIKLLNIYVNRSDFKASKDLWKKTKIRKTCTPESLLAKFCHHLGSADEESCLLNCNMVVSSCNIVCQDMNAGCCKYLTLFHYKQILKGWTPQILLQSLWEKTKVEALMKQTTYCEICMFALGSVFILEKLYCQGKLSL